MHVFLHNWRLNLTVYIYYCSLFSVTLLGFGRQGGCSFRLSPAKTGTVWFLSIVVYFYKGVSQHLGCLLSLASRPCLIRTFTWGLSLECPFEAYCLQRHRRGFRSCWWIFIVFPARYGFFFSFRLLQQSYRGSPLLSPYFSFPLPTHLSEVSSGFVLSLVFRGYPKFSEGLICSRERCPWKYSLRLLLFFSLINNASMEHLPSLWQDFECSLFSWFYMRRRG